MGQSDLPYAIEEGSVLEGIGSTAPEGSIFRELYEKSGRTGLCAENKELIKAGEFAETCMLAESLQLQSEDFSQSAECNLFIAQEFFLSVILAIAVQVMSLMCYTFIFDKPRNQRG